MVIPEYDRGGSVIHARRSSKFTISMPQDLLVEIDAEAEARGETRSGVIREASAQYLEHRREEDAAAERRRKVAGAIEIMRELASRPSLDDRPSLEILRELRETDGLGRSARRAENGGE